MRFTQIWLSILAAALLPCGCRRGGEPPADGNAPAGVAAAPAETGQAPAGQAPTGIFYPSDPVVFTKGATAGPLVPYTTGGPATSFNVEPPLPSGVVLDPATGALGGTPAASSQATVYRITARNAAGSTTKELSLTVLEPAPGQAPRITLAPAVTAHDPGQTASTQDQGAGATYTWTLSGASITAGQGSAKVTFTPGAPGPLDAQVQVSTSGGSVTGRASAQVVPAPDTTLTLPSWVMPGATGARASVPAQPGMTYSWSLTSGTASASLVSGQGTNQIGFTAGGTPGTFQVEVTVTNPAGRSVTNRGTVTVKGS
jgi:hypothetical protein